MFPIICLLVYLLVRNQFLQFLIIQWNLSSGQHRDLKKMSTIERCPLHRDFTQITLLLEIPAPKCIGAVYPYSPVGLLLLKLVKSADHFESGFIVSLSATFLPGTWSHWKTCEPWWRLWTWNSGKDLFLWDWKGHAVVGNETNRQRTIKREPKLLPQIKYNFLVEEWFCDTQY